MPKALTAANLRATLARIALALFLLAAPAVWGQELVTDRPDQTESALTVPAGTWQLETGWLWARDEEGSVQVDVTEVPGTLLRVGLSERWELRLGWSGYVRAEVDFGHTSGTIDGAGDGEVGAKVHLRPERGAAPEVALLFATSVPIGDEELTSDHADPSFRLSLAHTLSDRLSLGYNLGMEWETFKAGDEDTTLSRAIYTLALGIALGERTGAFVELFGDVAASDRGSPTHSLDGGLTWLVQDNLQLDVSGGVGLSDAAADWFVGAGLSVRFPR